MGLIIMPTELTAENGAKADLIGEFFETITLTCHECNGDGRCPACNGSGELLIFVPVSWTTIKKIYKRAVQLFARQHLGCENHENHKTQDELLGM